MVSESTADSKSVSLSARHVPQDTVLLSSAEEKTLSNADSADEGNNRAKAESAKREEITEKMKESKSAKLSELIGDFKEKPRQHHLKQKVLKLQHEGKLRTIGKGLERDMMKYRVLSSL